MNLDFFEYYLISINVIGFVAYGINAWLYNHTEDAQIDLLLTFICIMGGSFGIILFILLFDRKAVKDNMLSRVFVTCIFIIQLVIFLSLKGFISKSITFSIWNYFLNNKLLMIYLVVINIVSLVAFYIDKQAAIHHRYRIRIVSLLSLAFVGGSIGALLGMFLFNHKTNKEYFTIGVPLILVMQIVLIFYLMNVPTFHIVFD